MVDRGLLRGAAGERQPRKPRPAPGAAALERDEPERQRLIRLPRGLRSGTLADDLRRELGVDPDPAAGPDPGEPAPASHDTAATDGFAG